MSNEDLLAKLEDMGAEVDDVIERLGDDKALYVEYLHKFTQDDNIIKLRQAVEAKDASGAEHAVHTLKGMSLNLGLLPVTDVCMDMLMDFRAGHTEAAMEQLDDVEAVYKEWCDIING